MKEIQICAFNINAKAEIEGFSGAGVVTAERLGVGEYLVKGVIGLATEGWKFTIYRDDNSDNTIRCLFENTTDGLLVKTVDPDTREPKDIIHLLTLRCEVEVDVDSVNPSEELPIEE